MNIKKKALVGIDVSKDTFSAHFSGKDCKYPNSRKGWQALAKEAPQNSTYAMEATGYYHYRLASYLHSKGFAVVVFNPCRVKHYFQSLGIKAKTDKIDARGIAGYALARGVKIRQWEPMSPRHARARVIVSLLSGLSRFERSSGNIRHSLSLVLSKKDSLLNSMSDVKNVCREHQKALEKELYGLCGELFPNQFRLLKTIPGIGSKTAAVMLVCCKGLGEFPAYRQLVSFIGLAPTVKESGTSVRGKGRISKTGNPYLRSLLFMCAMSAVNLKGVSKSLYCRLLAKGKNKMLAMVAVMHRLVKISFGVVQSGEPYRGSKTILLPA
ncbi:MAG: IS110 family transposase [Fibromonadaceae bacterium]|jgi:transposase|nr:IS110 family transposase [Fibromonadaceae bacterium]